MNPSAAMPLTAIETARRLDLSGRGHVGRAATAQRAPQAAMARALLHGLDPVAFARDRLTFNPDAWQTRLLRSSSKRVILNCSRQSGKSTTTAVVACHTAIYKPGSLTLLVSKSLRQSSELFAKVSGFLSRIPEAKLTTNNKLSCELANGSRIISLPGDGDSIRGFSAVTLLIEDEAAFVEDALYMAVRPMLAVSGGRLILMSTPHGKRGHFYDAGIQWAKNGNARGLRLTTFRALPVSFWIRNAQPSANGGSDRSICASSSIAWTSFFRLTQS